MKAFIFVILCFSFQLDGICANSWMILQMQGIPKGYHMRPPHMSSDSVELAHLEESSAARHEFSTELRDAIVQGNTRLLEHYATADSVNAVNEVTDNIPLAYAAEVNAKKEVLEILLRKGANVDGLGQNDRTPLVIAGDQGNLDTIEVLLEHGAKVNQRNPYGDSPLMIAAELGYNKVVDLLIQKGADVNYHNDQIPRDSALTKAARAATPLGNYQETVKSLVQNGANVNYTNGNGQTALHMVAFRGDEKMVEFLLQNNADRSIRDRKNRSPIDWARLKGRTQVVKLLTIQLRY